MTISILAFLLAVLLLGVHTFYSIRTDGWRRYVGPIGFGCVTFFALFGFLQSLGGCIPSWAAYGTKMDVLAIIYDEPRSVYLWGVQDGSPKCVALPWSEEQAVAIRGQEQQGGELEYVHGTGPKSEGVLHPKPQEALPPKDME
jgi:hypothetical protein